MLTNSALGGICKNIQDLKKKTTVPDTLFQNTSYSHSPFLMVFAQ